MRLRRTVGVWGATSVGIANIIGAGIFVLSGVAAGIAGPSVILSFFIAGFIALMTALSAAELSSLITETGASYAFTKKAFGRFWSFLVGWFKYFDYTVGAAAVSVGFAAYFAAFFGMNGPTALALSAVGLPVALTILNLIGVRETARATAAMVFVKVFALVLLVMLGIFYLGQNFNASHYTPFFVNGLGGTLEAAAVVFFAFLGFNTVSMMSEETKNPEKTIPRALMIAFFVSFILYMAIAVVEIGVLDWNTMGSTASPLIELAAALTSNRMFMDFIAFSAMVATGSVALSSMIGGTRTSYVMGRDGLLPRQFESVSKRFGTPYISILVSGMIITVLAGLFADNIALIVSIVNFGSLFTYMFTHLSLIRLRHLMPKAKRHFRVPAYPVVPIIGIISCLFFMFYLSVDAKVAAMLWAAIGIVAYAVFHTKRSKVPLGFLVKD
ncbi:MAG: amino acid permease [Candidatus Aenigmarchaeota archaeon]|nr:amino acid permease [Candidatus Aenigmarchaeota archaeon]